MTCAHTLTKDTYGGRRPDSRASSLRSKKSLFAVESPAPTCPTLKLYFCSQIFLSGLRRSLITVWNVRVIIAVIYADRLARGEVAIGGLCGGGRVLSDYPRLSVAQRLWLVVSDLGFWRDFYGRLVG